jgi:hypothetical protein
MKRILQAMNYRRLAIVLVAVAIAVALVFGGLVMYRTLKYPAGEVLKAIPSNAILVAEGVGFLEFGIHISENSVWKTAMDASGQDDPLLTVVEKMQGAKALLGSEFEDLLQQQPFAMALIPQKENGPSLLYVIRMKEGVPESQIHSTLGKIFTHYKAKRLLEISYHELVLPGNLSAYVIAKDGLLLISADREVFELSYYTLESGNHLARDAGFMAAREQLLKSQNNVPFVMISHEALYGWFRRFLTSYLREVCSVISDAGSWSGLELTSLEQGIHLQGFTQVVHHRPAYFESMLLGGKSLSDPSSVLPHNTFFYDQMSVSGFSDFYRLCIDGYHHQERGDTVSYAIEKRMVDSLSLVLRESEIRSFLVAMTSAGDSGTVGEMLLVMEAARIETAKLGLSRFADTTQMFVYQGYEVNRITSPGIISALLGKRMVSFREAWYTIQGNHLVMAPGKESLMSVINSISLGRTLESIPDYSEGVSRIKGALSRRYYFNASTAAPFLRTQVISDKTTRFDSFVPKMPGQIFLGFTREDGVLLTDILVFPQSGVSKNDAFREVVLDDIPATEPVLLMDYRNKDMKVILADRLGNIYNLSYSAGPEWKMTPREAPASALKVIDMYQNGRQQCLFLSRSMLHIVQADGQYVKGYPVPLPAGFASHLAVFDYESNGNYRILYRDVQGRLMNVDLSGSPVAGWTNPSVSLSDRPVLWHRMNGIDFLVFTDEMGHFTTIDRRGKARFMVPDIRVFDRSGIGIGLLFGQPCFTFLTTEGFLYQVDAQGKATKHELIQFAPSSQLLALQNHGVGEILILEPANVSLFDQALKLRIASEYSETVWQSLHPIRGSGIFAAIARSHDGIPFVVHTKTAKITRLSSQSFDYSLAWYNQGASREEVLLIKGVLARIGLFKLQGK